MVSDRVPSWITQDSHPSAEPAREDSPPVRESNRARHTLKAITLAGLILATLVSATAHGAGLSYFATDLPDSVPGQDKWALSYRIQDAHFLGGEGFTVYFDSRYYSDLVASPVADAGWDALVTQPDPSVPFDGLFDVLALVDSPSITDTFEVAFTWAGAGRPGPQPYDFHDAAFTVWESGVTAAVPEPDSDKLCVAALAFLALLARRSAKSTPPD